MVCASPQHVATPECIKVVGKQQRFSASVSFAVMRLDLLMRAVIASLR
jgi:hypothetical protein